MELATPEETKEVFKQFAEARSKDAGIDFPINQTVLLQFAKSVYPNVSIATLKENAKEYLDGLELDLIELKTQMCTFVPEVLDLSKNIILNLGSILTSMGVPTSATTALATLQAFLTTTKSKLSELLSRSGSILGTCAKAGIGCPKVVLDSMSLISEMQEKLSAIVP